MKLIIREYLSSLREREELDAILPDLLSELGYTVFSRPARGTVQHGVDIAAVSPAKGRTPSKVYLFSVKRGDLTRGEWSSGPQSLRESLNEIRDAYIPTRIPAEYAKLKVVICLCFGGDMQEQVRTAVTGYIKQNTTPRISFEEWNGDKIAGLLLNGVLREEVLPKPLRASFQKAVALLDEPDVAYRHFAALCGQLRSQATTDEARVRAVRQLYIAVWVLYVWGRDLENLEAPYQASELAILTTWELLRPLLDIDNQVKADVVHALGQLTLVHFSIAAEFLDKKVAPHVNVRDGLGVAIHSQTFADINLKLFDLLGRIGMMGLWADWFSRRAQLNSESGVAESLDRLVQQGFDLIANNPALQLPVADHQTTDIALFLTLWLFAGAKDAPIEEWLSDMVGQINFSIRSRAHYPKASADYRDLLEGPPQTDEAFEEDTVGSTLIPTIAAWAAAMHMAPLLQTLSQLTSEKLSHTTMQLWTPSKDSEDALYINSGGHGLAICDLPITDTGKELVDQVARACASSTGWSELSAVRTGFEPIVLLACRHWRLPVPPDFYIGSVEASMTGQDPADAGPQQGC